MTLQGAVKFQEYFRCYVIDQEKVHVMRYDPGAAAPSALRAGQSAARRRNSASAWWAMRSSSAARWATT